MYEKILEISEKLNSQTLVDLGIEDAILQVHYPFELRDKIQMLKNDENLGNFW